ncbi:MAG: hypothetical protein KDC44_09100, partial [Phaeodactylibacter sp.]|nr:hypothetical protein [Phaeodactylibacter sp.]
LARQIEGVSRGAVFVVQGQLVLALELERGSSEAVIRQALPQLPFEVDAVYFSEAFPKDRRHGGKVLYRELEQAVQLFLSKR